MAIREDGRQKFIELSEAIFRELGFDPPAMIHEDSLPLAMELEYAGREFELLHSSTDMPGRFLVACKLGDLPDDHIIQGTRLLLQANLALSRMHKACYGIDPDKQTIKVMYYEKLGEVNARSVLENMQEMSTGASNWRDDFFAPPYAGTRTGATVAQFRLA